VKIKISYMDLVYVGAELGTRKKKTEVVENGALKKAFEPKRRK
jgi:hypothetical protein